MSVHELRATRAKTIDDLKTVNAKLDAFKPIKATTESEKAALAAARAEFDANKVEFKRLGDELADLDGRIERYLAVQEAERRTAIVAPGQDEAAHKTYAAVKSDIYTSKDAAEARGLITNKGLAFAGAVRMYAAAASNGSVAIAQAVKQYGENHPVTKALVTSVGAAGGFIVPPDQATEIIELLRPETAVRGANPRNIPMPRGTMTMPAQTSAATASYSGEGQKIGSSQPSFGPVVASFKKLTALVPGSNDLLRYSEPAADAIIRDDLVKVVALREDLAFLIGDGTQNTPRGWLSFANQYAVATGGSAGTWLTSGNSTLAVGGNFITSNETYTQATVANELAGAVNRLDVALVPDNRRVWFCHPRIYNYLFNLLNSLGLYVYREEMQTGKLLGYPIAKRTTQIPANYTDATSAITTGSLIFLAEMTETMIFDAMSMELMVSREGTYTDANAVTQSLVQNDQFLIRAIVEHDFQMRHPGAVAVIQNVAWAPAIQ